MAEDKTEDEVVETNESEELETPPEAVETPEVVENEVETPEPEVETPADELPEESEEEPVTSRRENKRIQELTRKLQEAQQQPQQLPQQRQIIGEGDYDLDQVNGMAEQYGAQRYSEGLAQANALAFSTRLEIDAPKVATRYDVLDQSSENFDPGVAAFINESYLKTVGYDSQSGAVQNNNIRYEEYVDGMMELVDTLSQGKQADSTKNLAKQAAQTGVRPSGVSKQYSGTDPSKMTLEQLQVAALEEAKRVRF